MLHKAHKTSLDEEHLKGTSGAVSGSSPSFDYHNLVVNKPWGYEYLLFENTSVAVWILFLKQNHATSMHCHPNKKTSLVVLEGSVETTTLDAAFTLSAHDGLFIDAGVFHSTKAVSSGGAMIMEIETPPNKNDLVRLRDNYGREGKAYEGISAISFDTHDYHYLYFKPGEVHERRSVKNQPLSLHYHKQNDDLYNHVSAHSDSLVAIVEGCVLDPDGSISCAVGQTIHASELKGLLEKGHNGQNITVLTIHR